MEQSIYFQAYQDEINQILIDYQGICDSFYVNDILYPAILIQKNEHYSTYQIQIELDFESIYILKDKHFNQTILKRRYIVKSKEFDDYFYYPHSDLGCQYTPMYTTFKVWAPLSTQGYLHYKYNDQIFIEPLIKKKKGIFEVTIHKNLENALYHYLLKTNGEWVEVNDPYSYSCNENSQESAVIQLEKINCPLYEENLTPLTSQTQAIIYEVNVRDFSSNGDFKDDFKGYYQAFCLENKKSPQNHPIGIDYLSFLGITHVQFMPILDFVTVDEMHPINQYNWGYDPAAYNWFEGSYSSNPKDPYQRLLEVKKIIQTLHQRNIRVVFDLVFNHFYFTKENVLNKLVPNYFFKMNKEGMYSNGSFCGNDYDSTLKMARKYLVDMCIRYVSEYKVDGFRMDLMGILDIETIKEIYTTCKKINSSFILYGEGWNMPSFLNESKRASLNNANQLFPVAFFNDYFRDIVKGKNSDRELSERGYINGNTGFVYEMMKAMKGSIDDYCYFMDACQSINYIECHDNATLHDKFLISNEFEDETIRNNLLLLSLASVIFSLGIPFLHIGCEFHRSKKGKTNTYNESDAINSIKWNQIDDYFENCLALKGFIRLRKKYNVFQLHKKEEIQQHFHYQVLEHNILKIYYQDLKNIDGIEELVMFFNPSNQTHHYDFNHYFKYVCSEHGPIRNDVYCSNIRINPYSFAMYIKEIQEEEK